MNKKIPRDIKFLFTSEYLNSLIPVNDFSHFLEFLHTLLMILIRRVSIPPSENRVLEPLPELLGGAEDPLVDEVYEGEVLEQIVLYRGS